VPVGTGTRVYITGKMTWCANKDWILSAHTANGGAYIGGAGSAYPLGIPMFVQSNHNP
jgi:hypothetical protein